MVNPVSWAIDISFDLVIPCLALDRSSLSEISSVPMKKRIYSCKCSSFCVNLRDLGENPFFPNKSC